MEVEQAVKFYRGFKTIGEDFTPALKIWSNGLALKADTWKSCTNFCTYCYARDTGAAMMQAGRVKYDPTVARGMNITTTRNIFEGAYSKRVKNPFMEWSIRTNKYIELGTLGETFQEADLKYRLTDNFLQLCNAYKMPLFINTKMNLLCKSEEYYNMVVEHSAPVIICATLTTTDDDKVKAIEPNAPLPSERLETIKRLKKDGVPTVIYTAPYLVDYTDDDLAKYTNDLIEAGAVGAHLRNFYFVAKLHKQTFWRKYYAKHKANFKGDRWGAEVLINAANRMREVVGKRDFQVVGLKKSWFDMEPFHGKLAFDYLPERFRKPIVDFTFIPILRKIRQNKTEPQLLLWDEIGFKKDMIDYPDYIKISENSGLSLITTICTCGKRPVANYKMKAWNWIKGGMWAGYIKGKPEGRIAQVANIYPVTDSKSYKRGKDQQDVYYAYVPQALKSAYVKEGTVSWEEAKSFHTPKRKGGVEDKFYTRQQLKRL